LPNEDNRTQILAHALELFSKRGYDVVGIQELVKTVGVSKPTLYHYFGSKKGLLEILIKEKLEPFKNQLALLADYKGDLPFTLRKITEHYFNFAITEPKFCRLNLSLSFPIPENEAYLVMRPWIQAQRAILEEMFKSASVDHGNMINRQHHFANSFLFFLNGQIALIYTENAKVDEQLIWNTVQQFSHGIYS
tara:strand:+ start:3372 stop:3947 length:576 start_codon:yes stop_codon:yes gene_type:complete